jgi:hypothetical protein
MIRISAAAAALCLALVSPPVAWGQGPFVGVYGPKGNDTGGIIPWSVENESMMMMIAQDNCGYYGKTAVITNIHRVYGDFISYQCVFGPPRERWIGRRPR